MATQSGAPAAGTQELSPAVYVPPTGDNSDNSDAYNPAVYVPPTGDNSDNISLTAYNPPATVNIPAPPQAYGQHSIQLEAESWLLVTKALMGAVIASQQPAVVAMTLFTIFKPMVDGFAAARKEAARWKVRAEAHMGELHRQKSELGQKHESFLSELRVLEQKLSESQGLHKTKTEEAQDLGRLIEAKQRESDARRKAFHSTVAEFQKKFVQAEADTQVAKEANRKEAERRKKEAEALAKRAQEAKLLQEKLRQEAEKKERGQTEEITKLREKIKENETNKSKLKEQLRATISKNASLEMELAQKSQDYSSLESRATELTKRKEALERQLPLFQKVPTRWF